MSVFSLCRVCQLWKMLVEHSAPWRHVPDILQSMYGFYLGNRSKVSALNWRGSSVSELGSLERGGGISDGWVQLWCCPKALHLSLSSPWFWLKAVDFRPLVIRVFGCCREKPQLSGFSPRGSWDSGCGHWVWNSVISSIKPSGNIPACLHTLRHFYPSPPCWMFIPLGFWFFRGILNHERTELTLNCGQGTDFGARHMWAWKIVICCVVLGGEWIVGFVSFSMGWGKY